QYNLKLEGIEEINGKEAYSLQAEDQNGKVTTYYFDTETGLELREVSTTQTAKGAINKTTNYSDYKEVNALKFHFKMESKNDTIAMSITVDSIQINQGLTPEDFKYSSLNNTIKKTACNDYRLFFLSIILLI